MAFPTYDESRKVYDDNDLAAKWGDYEAGDTADFDGMRWQKVGGGWRVLGWVKDDPQPPDTFSVFGNPGNVPLHESLAGIAQWIDYEGEVVEAAAEGIDDPEIKEAAEEQAEAMQEAAEAVSEAAGEAAETAAEVFTETGVPSDEQPAEVVAGNPSDAPTPIQHGGEWITPWAFHDSAGYHEWSNEEVKELVNGLDAGTYTTDPQTEQMLRGRYDVIMGNPTDRMGEQAVEGNPAPRAYEPDSSIQHAGSGHTVIVYDFGGNEVIGRIRDADGTHVFTVEGGSRADVIQRAKDWVEMQAIAEGNPTVSGEMVTEIDVAPTAETAATDKPDTPPEPGHWYFRSWRK